jgi:hypothetical protein
MKKNITITCTENQAKIIESCLDCCSRIGAGQLHHISNIIDLCRGKIKTVKLPNGEDAMFYKLGSWIEDQLKPILFPELHRNGSYGVGCKEIPNGQIMYEMVKVLQNYRVRNLSEDVGGVLKHAPLHYSKEPLIEVQGKTKIKCKCEKIAQWFYLPSDSLDRAYCDECVPRGCSCNEYPLDGNWENLDPNNWTEELDKKGRKKPCCEFCYDKKGWDNE